MKIGFICNEYPPEICGGVGTFTRELAEQLVAAGHEVRVIGVYSSISSATTQEQNGVIVERLPAKPGRLGIWQNRRALYHRVKALAKSGELELIEIPDFEGYSAFWGRLDIPVLLRLHGTVTYFNHELKQPNSRLIAFLERQALRRADRLVSVSQYAAEQTLSVFQLSTPYSVVHNGIAIPSAEQTKQQYAYQGKVVFTGSIMPKKGVLSLAEAWPSVRAQFPDAELIIVGKDTQHHGRSVKQQMQEIVGPEHPIIFTGHIDKKTLQQHLLNADVAVFPSYSETFGLGPVEAMALAVPTIYTELSCGPEIVQHEKNGLLINPEQPKTIANALNRLLNDQSQREFFGQQGRAHAATFSVAEQLALNVAVYEQLIGASRK